METVTKPMALDETLQATNGKMDTTNTKLQGIINALSTLAGQTADNVEYDNTDSGLTATDVQDAIDEVVEGVYASTSTLTGNPIVVEGKKLAVSTKVTFEPIQAGSGDPSPSNIREISGYDEIELTVPRKNLAKNNMTSTEMNGVIWTKNSDGSITVSGTPTANSYIDNAVIAKVSADAENICISGLSGVTNIVIESVKFWDKDNNLIYTQSVNSASDKNYDLSYYISSNLAYVTVVYKRNTNNVACSGTIKPQIEIGTAPTSYEPYNPITDITLNLPETVYGGTLNVETGELVVDRGYAVFDGSDDETWGGDAYGKYIEVDDMKQLLDYSDSIFCDKLATATNYAHLSEGDISGWVDPASPDRNWIYVGISETIKPWLQTNPLTVVYPLADEYKYTIHLTPAQIRLLTTQSVITTNGTTIELTVSNAKVASIEAVDSVKESVNALDTKSYFKQIGVISGAQADDIISLSKSLSSLNELLIVPVAATWSMSLGSQIIMVDILKSLTGGCVIKIADNTDSMTLKFKYDTEMSIELDQITVSQGWSSTRMDIFVYGR